MADDSTLVPTGVVGESVQLRSGTFVEWLVSSRQHKENRVLSPEAERS